MAIIEIQNARVDRIFHNGTAFVAVEEFKTTSGGTGEKKFTVWNDTSHGLSEGQRVTVRGFYGAKVDEFDSPNDGIVRYVQTSINKPKITVLDGAEDDSEAPF